MTKIHVSIRISWNIEVHAFHFTTKLHSQLIAGFENALSNNTVNSLSLRNSQNCRIWWHIRRTFFFTKNIS